MNKTDKIYVAGHRGLVGSAIVRNLQSKGYTNIIGRTHKELDLTNQAAVRAFFETEKPDVVVLDMIMPKMGGHSTFYRIRELDPNIKVLLSSGYVAPDAVNDLLANGAAGFLQKPHRIKTLAYELRRILDTPAQEKTPSPV